MKEEERLDVNTAEDLPTDCKDNDNDVEKAETQTSSLDQSSAAADNAGSTIPSLDREWLSYDELPPKREPPPQRENPPPSLSTPPMPKAPEGENEDIVQESADVPTVSDDPSSNSQGEVPPEPAPPDPAPPDESPEPTSRLLGCSSSRQTSLETKYKICKCCTTNFTQESQDWVSERKYPNGFGLDKESSYADNIFNLTVPE
ncbi:hypothetical protein IV203_021032 [Nitzschia inconspicua]|uniref:Uncharacterized protein n=1 Tax=Nitzschia inconspicua TaxID=303405 RepID=A0A9K3KGG8_9STRA|nr:hypothetical protein IV203_021032 [Nitzschia inconspicua]